MITAAPAMDKGAAPHPSLAILTPATENGTGHAMMQPQAVSTPVTQLAEAAVTLAALRKPGMGKDPKPPAPLGERAKASSTAASTSALAAPLSCPRTRERRYPDQAMDFG